MTTVALRCDGDDRIGAGHVARCAQVARAFATVGIEPVLVGRFEGTAAQLVAAAEVMTVACGDGPLGLPPDATLAVVDSYAIPVERVVDAAQHLPLAVFRDFGEPVPGALTVDYHADPHPLAELGGFDYAPVDPRFTAARRKRGLARALVTVGGGTAGAGLRERAVAAARAAGLQPEVPGGAGSAPAGLVEAVQTADIAIGAAGLTAYEMACAGLPSGLVAVADNQRRVASGMVARGVALAGHDPAQLLRGLADSDLRASFARRGPAAIDGCGTFRIRDALVRFTAGKEPLPPLRLRPATADDGDLQLRWRNDPAARAASRDERPVSTEEHRAWYTAAIADSDRLLLIAEDVTGPIGSVRFDIEGRGAEISVVLAPERRGSGLGRRAIAVATELLLASRKGVDRVVATVLAGNEASAKAFRAAGFAARGGEAPGPLGFVLERAHLASAS